MAEELYDQKISFETDWGGDESTGGLKVKGSRVQEFIKDELSNRPIKKIKTQVGIQEAEEAPVELDGSVTINIPTIEVDDQLNDVSTNPPTSKAVYNAIEEAKQGIGNKLEITGGTANEAYVYRLALQSPEGEELSYVEFNGGTGEGATINRLILRKETEVSIVKLGSRLVLQYYFDHVDPEGSSTGNTADITVQITSGADSNTLEFNNVRAGMQSVDVTDYIRINNNTIKITANVDNGDKIQSSSISWNITAVELKLTSSYNLATPIVTKGNDVIVKYELSGTGSKTFKWYVDGEQIDSKVINGNSPGQVVIDTTELNHGSHTLEMVAELYVNSMTTIYSNSICIVFGVKELDNESPIIVARFDYPEGDILDGEKPFIEVYQFEDYTLQYAVWHPTKSKALVEILENEVVMSSRETEFVANTFSRRVMETPQTIPSSIVCEDVTFLFDLKVVESSLNIVDPTDSMALKLSAQGKSNSDINYNEWTYKDITTTLTGFKWGGDGWLNDALYLTEDARAEINYKPLQSTATKYDNSFAVSIRFRVTKVMDENATVISCMDTSNDPKGVGFKINAQEAIMRTSASLGDGPQISMKMEAGSIYDVVFVSIPITDKNDPNASDYLKQNSGMVLMYINGILSGCVRKDSSSVSIYQPSPVNITLGSSDATLEVFEIRSYDSYLTSDQVLNLYILHQSTIPEMEAMYERNNIVDGAGAVTVDMVSEGMRYMIVTGDYDGNMSMIEHAALENNKDNKYDVEEILCAIKGNPEYNFVCRSADPATEGNPYIRLQGTSSLAYPIKNYRIYTKTQSKTLEDPSLYLGCDEQGNGGVRQEKSKYSFRGQRGSEKPAAPVNCWCLKADYAESSSSHNTGMARMASQILLNAGELTPPQIHADSSYPYDIRTTVDGEPCYMFYRKTKEEDPKFLGKFNFNNDKSTEDVFGFLDIPGYHITDSESETPTDWISTLYGGQNPTECWEFSTNDSSMGIFKDLGTTPEDFLQKVDSDGKLLWNQTWEPRYLPNEDDEALWEDGTLDPVLLRTTAQWISSTDTEVEGLSEEDKEQRRQKFRDELHQYFNVNFLCDYYMFTDVFGMVDQRVKNMMLAFWHDPDVDPEENSVMKGMRGYFIFYDNDTMLGVRNDGQLKYGWDINEETIDPELGAYAYAGHDSVLWKNLRDLFQTELGESFRRLRAKMTNETIFQIFDTEQSAKFCERVYNIDALNKYIIPNVLGSATTDAGSVITKYYNYLSSMQGSRQAHRHWWITNRIDQFDARYQSQVWSGDLYRISIKGDVATGMQIKAIATREYYYAVEYDTGITAHTKVSADNDYTWDFTFNRDVSISNASYIHGTKWSRLLDFSKTNVDNLVLPALSVLEDFILGTIEAGTTSTLKSMAFDSMEMLRRVWVENLKGLTSLNFEKNTRLEEVHAFGSNATSVTLAEGAPIKLLELPATFTSLKLRSQTVLTREGIQLEDPKSITEFWIDNCPNIDAQEYFNYFLSLIPSGGKLKYVRVTGIDITGVGEELRTWYESGIKGITANGLPTDEYCALVGTYHLTNYMEYEEYNKYKDYFKELEIIQPEYTVVQYDTNVADEMNISNLDNKTGYTFGNKYEPSAHLLDIMRPRHRYLGKQAEDGIMTICQLHDENSNYYADAENVNNATPAILDSTEGDVFVYEPHYWFKGINDYLNNKNYSCYSSNKEKPKTPECKIITYDEIASEGGVRENYVIEVNKPDLQSSLTSVSNYSVCKINVQGYKKVRFPSVVGVAFRGATFFDSEQKLVKSIITDASRGGFIDGMYVITDIPENAIELHFTINSLIPEKDIVVLSNSDKIEDMEPDWVEHPECLLGAFEASLKGSSLYSVVSTVPPNINLTQDNFVYYANLRKLQVIDWSEYNHIANLFCVTYGRRNSQKECGVGHIQDQRNPPGGTAKLGMMNTISYNKDGIYSEANSFYLEKDEFNNTLYTVIRNTNCMGYENLFNNSSSSISNIIKYKRESSENVSYWTITNPDKSIRKVYQSSETGYLKYVYHQKYMDVFNASYIKDEGSSTTYYCDNNQTRSDLDPSKDSVLFTISSGNAVNGIFAVQNGYATNKIQSSRIMFRGNISIMKNVNEFKQLKALY